MFFAVDMPPLSSGTPPSKAKSPMQQQLEQELQLVKLAEQQQKEREEQEAAQEEENTGRKKHLVCAWRGQINILAFQLQSLW